MKDYDVVPNDLSAYWLGFTPNRRFKADPRLIVAAEGMHYTSADGRQILDSSAGLWCVNIGHGDPHVREAIKAQVDKLEYSPQFQFSTPAAFNLGNRLAEMMPGDLNHVFYTNSGSESVDTALKIALHYHRLRGEGSRTRLIGRERGYHGVGFGGISVGGMVPNRKFYGSLLTGVDHMRHTWLPENAYAKGCPETGADLADDLERICALHDPSTIAAVIVEPMAGSTGVLPPPVGYLQRLRDITRKHGILLVFDEVICGFGRLGASSAAEHFGVTPDLMTLAKGLTSGYIPMGAVMVSDEIYQSAMDHAQAPMELTHGYTYSAHPMAVAAANATLDVYESRGLFARAAALAPKMEEKVHALKGERHVMDIRNLGFVGAVELEPRPGAVGARGQEVMEAAWAKGLMLRISGDTIAFSPPLIAEENHLDQMFDITREILADLD